MRHGKTKQVWKQFVSLASHATCIDKRSRSVTKLARANGLIVKQVSDGLYRLLATSAENYERENNYF